MKKSFSFWQFSALILICTALLSTGIFLYVHKLDATLTAKRTAYLSEVAKQSAITIRTQVRGDLNLLQAVATAIGAIPQPTEAVITSLMKAESAANNFKRMGFVYPDGMAVLSDDLLIDISRQSHFQKALAGEPNVSNRIPDSADGQDIVVEAVPVYHNGNIIGVLFATRGTQEYADMLDVESFRGEGYSVIVRANGDKMVGSLHKNAVSGMYNIFNSPDDPDHRLAALIEKKLQTNQSGTITYTSTEKGELHISYEPLGINDWYLFSVVPTATLTAQVNALIWLLLMLCIAVALAGLAVWGYFYLEHKRNRKQLYKLAYLDPVTGFPNAEANRPAAQKLLKEHPENRYAVVALDVSKFKIFNEQHGYQTGNILLTHIARVINANLEQDEICTRVYGDFFAMLLKYTTEGALKNRLELLGEQITSFETEDRKAYPLLLAFGVYPVEERGMPIRMMYNRATVAKSQVKGRYDEIVAFYRPDWQQTLEDEEFVERQMQQALKKKEFRFFLEPIISLADGKISAALALADWRVPGRKEPLTMRQFLPIFRKNGFIFQFDRFLFESACEMLAKWKKDGTPLIPVVVNISNELLYSPDFPKRAADKAAEYGVDTKWLILELTETNRADFLPQLKRSGEALVKAGFGLTVRYEGRGVTLSNIFQHLPIIGIKAAPSIWTPSADEKQNVMARALTDICRKLGIFLAADGVLNQAETDHIKELGFQYAQGPFAAPGVTPEELAKRIREQNGLPPEQK